MWLDSSPGAGYTVCYMVNVEERAEQPYVAIRAAVPMRELGSMLPPLMPEVLAWSLDHGRPPAGPPFWKYDVIDMDGELEIEVGVPVAEPVQADGRIVAGVLPAGKYATTIYVGHPSGLYEATSDLLAWAEREGLAWDVDGQRWGCRLEEYLSDPAEVPDMNDWQTRLAFRLA